MAEHTIAGLRAQFKAAGKFHTPPELALFLRSLIPDEPRDVYDPTCGAGALLSTFNERTMKYGQDIDAEALSDAMLIPNTRVAMGDVLEDPAFLDRRFQAIVANPPFSIKWRPHTDDRFCVLPTIPTAGRADMVFIAHIIHMLADDGTAAVLVFPGVLYRGGREQLIRQWLVEQNLVDQVISIPGDTFTDTSISTACIVIKKNRNTSGVLFIDRENDIERLVEQSEIEANDFSLSVSTYVQPEREEEPTIDPMALQREVIKSSIEGVRQTLEVQKMVCELEGTDFYPIWQQVRNAVDEMKPARVREYEHQIPLIEEDAA